MNLIEAYARPVLSLKKNLNISDKFREEYNLSMKEGDLLQLGPNTFIGRPATIAKLRKQLDEIQTYSMS